MIGSFLITTVRGVPIRLHFTALFLLPWFYGIVDQNPDIVEVWRLPITLLLIFLLLLSVALHELGHTLVAQRYRMRVQDIILTPVGGVARLMGGVNDPRHEIRIAMAGPYVSLFLAATGYALQWGAYALDWRVLGAFSFYFFMLNLLLFGFNLVPCFPMDGGRVLRGWLAQRKGMMEATRIAAGLGKGISITFMLVGFTTGRYNLLIIGIFIFMAAGSEYRMMRIKAWQEQNLGRTIGMPGGGLGGGLGGAEPEQEVEVSPPPYAPESKSREPKGFAGDLFAAARDLVEETFTSR